jgi:hypothetical protein
MTILNYTGNEHWQGCEGIRILAGKNGKLRSQFGDFLELFNIDLQQSHS